MTKRIGLIVGMEDTFPAAFMEAVNRTPGYTAELAKIGGTPEVFTSPYAVLIDRLSHEVPFYRFHLKAAMLGGAYVINDPFWWSADEKFFGFSVAPKLGVKVPRTVMLPQKAYMERIDPSRSLRNLEYPLDWEAIAEYVGFPAILKPADGGGWRDVSRVNDMGELLAAYDRSGQTVMTLQEFVDFDEYVRCLCIGREFVLPIQYDPRRKDARGLNGVYVDNPPDWMPRELETPVLDACWSLNRALGYDMNSVELAVKDGVPYAIDFTNPAPDMCSRSLGDRYFRIVVEEMARFAIQKAKEGRPNDVGYAWRREIDAPSPRPAGLNEAPRKDAPAPKQRASG
ncbi:MAG TPA: hypothetical protein VK013_18340 [Myxococcaceae bacterium]|nr:hypothetical protein [Myxococcaceae bacterium]